MTDIKSNNVEMSPTQMMYAHLEMLNPSFAFFLKRNPIASAELTQKIEEAANKYEELHQEFKGKLDD